MAKERTLKTFRGIATALGAVMMSAGVAAAADYSEPVMTPYSGGFYVTLQGGYMMLDDPSVSFISGGTVNAAVDVDNGYRLGGAIGYDFNDNVALEFETSYIHTGVNAIYTGLGGALAPGDGSAITLMGNAVIGNDYGPWRPYVGAGIGAALVSLDVDFMSDIDDSDWAFSAQAFAGVDYQLSDRASIGGRYRFQHIGSTDYADGNGNPVGLGGLNLHSFEVVLKFKFGG